MKEKAVADFVGRYVVDPSSGMGAEPGDCRVVMSRRRVVVATGSERITIPLSAVVDVVVGNVPTDLRDLFDDTATIAYEVDGGVRTVLLEASNDTMSQFTDLLFRCLLNGTEGVVKHPAKVGGRVTRVEATPARLSVDGGRVSVSTPGEDFEIDVGSVVDFDRTERAPDGDERPTLVVTHADGQDVVTTLLAPDSGRMVNLFGRYLRLEYSQVRREIEEIELDDPEKRVLVTVYAAGGDVDLTEVIDGDAARATEVLNALRENGLVREGETGLELTSRGQVVVTQRLEDVDV